VSETQICNRALQKIGAARITSIDELSPRAEDCKSAYYDLRDAELRNHVWKFALSRRVLAPLASAPEFEFDYEFLLPSDFLRLHPAATYQEETDWTIEGNADGLQVLRTNDGDTLYLRYVRQITDTAVMDSLFKEALAVKIAHELAEPATKGLNRKSALAVEYKEVIARAKLVDAIEKISAEPPEDVWVKAARY